MMTSPTSIPTEPLSLGGLATNGMWHSTFRSMASPVRVQLGRDAGEPAELHRELHALFGLVDAQCTRFDPDSDLMCANAAADRWRPVGGYCFEALLAARDAHRRTDGMFDPRVLRRLVDLGYDRTLPFADGVDVGARSSRPQPARGRWEPEFELARRRVRVGSEPIDLGGIGKGLALRWAAAHLRGKGCNLFLVDAGGDCIAAGGGPDGCGWRVGVEDPFGGDTPVAVVTMTDAACATSSTRWLSWRAGERRVHHLIDPRSGEPGGAGLRAVTVLADDAADAEVWSKVLFLHGIADIEWAARRHGLRALWVPDGGGLGMSEAMGAHVIWRRP